MPRCTTFSLPYYVRITSLAAPRQDFSMHTSTRTLAKLTSPMNTLRAIAAASALFVTSRAHAQQQTYTSAALLVYANVIQPLNITAMHNLEFGTLIAGTTKTILPSSTSSGQFQILGEGGAVVAVTFSMPTALSLTGNDAVQLPVSDWTYFTTHFPTAATSNGEPGTAMPLGTPVNLTLPLNAFGPGHIALGIGATATASPSQQSGDYTGIGDIEIAYADY